MEPPAKRMRLGQSPYDDNDDDEANLDELSMDPTQFDARQDPLYELDKGRAKAASRLKSAFERIFEKYERDFTDVGDEIDLETGEVIVNNGHLLSLEDEKDRNREGSISSNEEERIMRGKETKSVEASHTKSSVQSTSSTHPHPPLGFPAGPSQQVMAYQYSSPAIPPNPYGFMDPFMGHGPADPLWQTPDLPIPLYQDRFGFIGQSMGYPPSFGYGYGPMLAPGGFGHGTFGDVFSPQVPKKLPPTKAPARQLLPRVPSDADDSGEDDVLLGSNTEEVVKSVSIKSIKALPSIAAAEKTKQMTQKDAKPTSTAKKEKDTPKSRRGRPKKVAVPAKPPDSNNEANEKHGENIEANIRTGISNSTEPTNNSIVTPTLPSPPSEEHILKRKIGTELTEAELVTEVLTEVATEGDTQPVDSQRRRSSRGRKKTEFYGQITWTKSPKSNASGADAQYVKEDLVDEPPNSPPIETNRSPDHVRPEQFPQQEIMEFDSDARPEEVGKKEFSDKTHVAIPNQEYHEESPVNTGDLGEGEIPQSTLLSPPKIIESLEQSDSLFSIGGPRIDEVLTSSQDKEVSPDETEQPIDPTNEEPLVYPLEDTVQDTDSIQPNVHEGDLEGLTIEGAAIEANIETTPSCPTDKEIPAVIEEAPEASIILNDHQETPQSPTTQIQLEEATAHLPDPVPEENLFPEPEIAESEIAETESTEEEMPLKSTPSRPSLTEDSDPLSLPEEDEPTLPPARLPIISHQSKVPGLFEKAELALRPQVSRREPRTKIIQGRSSASPSKSPSPSKHRLSQSAKPGTTTPIPSTPKKRKDPQPETSHGTASARKKYALTSLIPDDPDEDDDELSVLASSVAPSPFLSSYTTTKPHSRFDAHTFLTSTPRKPNRHHGFLTGSTSTSRSALRTPHRISKRGVPPATDSRASKRRFAGGSGGSGVQSSPLARTVLNLNHREALTATPSKRGRNGGDGNGNRGRTRDRDEAGSVELGSSPVRTPGGTARRCGEGGFTCDRDFCFTCCK
ncbi:uncharacterized protein GGS22DRAFT_47752 [Annulohypoxylon maeteangense]|uniref:uncharacterized protein n=1 Tax=Annulohypoxylon maeteangense TaxID=1927788 RepID=UPI0020080204|nr:uncharacterized protein GGS22DRAFT_47752 [Annulohypoxylon maeteangense]KAI0882098.1 hypothetical protein GGS22DRAFT_47752 [Annulohypoxylon maeteangense]